MSGFPMNCRILKCLISFSCRTIAERQYFVIASQGLNVYVFFVLCVEMSVVEKILTMYRYVINNNLSIIITQEFRWRIGVVHKLVRSLKERVRVDNFGTAGIRRELKL